jgi:hypothetical protein
MPVGKASSIPIDAEKRILSRQSRQWLILYMGEKTQIGPFKRTVAPFLVWLKVVWWKREKNRRRTC